MGNGELLKKFDPNPENMLEYTSDFRVEMRQTCLGAFIYIQYPHLTSVGAQY